MLENVAENTVNTVYEQRGRIKENAKEWTLIHGKRNTVDISEIRN